MARHGTWGFELTLVVLGLLAMAQQSMQLSSRHPLHGVIQRINAYGPYYGLVMVADYDEKALIASNSFIPSNYAPVVSLAGRKFHVGQIKGANVIYVKTGDASVNAALTVQLLIDAFDIYGIVHFGDAGVVNDKLFIGDVALVGQAAFTGYWNWKKFEARKGLLKFGDFNLPEPGKNKLGSIDFQPSILYTPSGKKTVFFFPLSNTTWFDVASQLQDVIELEDCINRTAHKCLPEKPKLVPGIRAATSDLFLTNAAYREYLSNQFKVSIIDEETAAVASVAFTNGVPVVVFRGVSNTAGGPTSYKNYGDLGSINAFTAAAAFIGAANSVHETSSMANYSIV